MAVLFIRRTFIKIWAQFLCCGTLQFENATSSEDESEKGERAVSDADSCLGDGRRADNVVEDEGGGEDAGDADGHGFGFTDGRLTDNSCDKIGFVGFKGDDSWRWCAERTFTCSFTFFFITFTVCRT